MKTQTEFELLFNKAQKELTADQLRYWLCFAYGYLTVGITDKKEITLTAKSLSAAIEKCTTI